jgi:hypothetical protein
MVILNANQNEFHLKVMVLKGYEMLKLSTFQMPSILVPPNKIPHFILMQRAGRLIDQTGGICY